MSDKVAITDPHNVPVVFASDVAGTGFLNGVVNITLATARFTPSFDTVETDLIVAARIRMDLYAAQRLHAFLGQIIEDNTKGPAQPAPKTN